MRDIPEDLAAELASGATTLCRCWKALRADGTAMGFTDHDRDLVIGSLTFRAATGLDASAAESLLGLAVGGGDIAGALMADAISDQDIEAGLWDLATIETWLVDWRDVSRRMLLDTGQIGDIRRHGESFTAEVRGYAHVFDQEQGRRYQGLCSAELGDGDCGVSLVGSGRRLASVIAVVPDPASFGMHAPAGFGPGSFRGGVVTFTSGASAGIAAPVMSHTRVGSRDMIALWSPPVGGLAPGDAFIVTVGCDKQFSTCRDRFANALNYRGFPHLPGNDFLLGYARQGEPGQDGGALVP